jgi:hypothetical protein
MLMPLSEASILDQIQLFLLPSSPVLLRSAVVVAILSPALFFFGGLALNDRLLQEEAARVDGPDLARIQRAAFQQACLSAWTGTACALWGGVYLFMASKEDVPVIPITGLVCLGLVLVLSAVWTVRIGRLALQMRRVLIETGQLSLSDAEAAGWFVLPYFLLLSFLGIWYGPWMEGLALAALVAGGGLGLYALVTRSGKKPGARFWLKESAELSASWPAIVLGLVGPLLPALASGLAVLALPISFLPYLDNHPEAVGLSVPRLLAEYSVYQPLSFVGLLLLVAAFIGLIALFGTIRSVLSRRSV